MRNVFNTLRDFVIAHWAILTLVGFVLVLHWDLLTWAVPATGDHMIHMYKGWLMSEHMLPSGRLTGWSNMAFAGYPAGVYYPILGDLLIAVTRRITFGLFTWERTYALFFMVLVVAIPVSVYFVTRRLTGPFGALVAGTLITGDVGGWPQGGHVSTVYWAVWPFILGLVLAMTTVVVCEKVIIRPIGKHPIAFIGFVMLLACTVLAHPMASFFLGLSVPTLVIVVAISERKKAHPVRVIGRAAFAALAAFVLSSFWTVPWITTGSEWTLGWPAVGFGGMWMSLPRLLKKLATNELFYDFYWVAWILGVVGFVPALLTRKRWPVYAALLLVTIFLFVGFANTLGDGVMARKVQIERMAAFMKFVWFVLAGFAVDRAAFGTGWLVDRLPARWREGKWATVRRVARPALMLVVLVAIVAAGWTDNYKKSAGIGRLGGDLWDDIMQAEKWLEKQERGPLDRVLYQPGKLCVSGNLVSPKCNEVYHRHIFASAPVHTNLPKLKFGYEATAIFRNVPLAHRWPYDTQLIQHLYTNPRALENLHVRWIFSIVKWPQRDDLELVKEIGQVMIYSVETGKKPPVRLEGPGTISVEHFSDERVVVRVSGSDSSSRIRYPIAYFYPWRAYHEGDEIEVARCGVLPNAREILITVEARDGVTELLYVRPWWETTANRVSLFAWVACLVLMGGIVVRNRRRGSR